MSPADLRACGFTPKAVRHRLAEGHWHRVGGAVVLAPRRSHVSTWSDAALAWVLHFTFGPQSRISGVLALRRARWNLPCESHIVVIAHKPYRGLDGVTILRRSDTTASDRPGEPRFVPAREALIDCLTVLPAGLGADLLDAALQKRYVSPVELTRDIAGRLGRGRSIPPDCAPSSNEPPRGRAQRPSIGWRASCAVVARDRGFLTTHCAGRTGASWPNLTSRILGCALPSRWMAAPSIPIGGRSKVIVGVRMPSRLTVGSSSASHGSRS